MLRKTNVREVIMVFGLSKIVVRGSAAAMALAALALHPQTLLASECPTVADPKGITVGDCVKRSLRTVTGSMDLVEAANIMRETGFRQLVVVDDAGVLAGVFSMRDLVVGLLEERTVTA